MRPRPTARVLAAATAAIVLATACGGGDGDVTRAPDATDDATAATAAPDEPTDADGTVPDEPAGDADLAASRAALDFTTVDLDGGDFVGGDLAGRDVVLWVWAPWCSVCNREAPQLRDTFAARSADVVLLGLPGKDSVEAHRGFVAEHDLGFLQHVVDQDGSIWQRYGVAYQPAFVFIDDDGTVRVHAGPMEPSALDAAIDELVAS